MNTIRNLRRKYGAERKDDPPVTCRQKTVHFLVAHWKGIVIITVPLSVLFLVMPPPGKPYAWCGFTMIVMAAFWVSECIPLPVTSFLPLLIFPLTGVMDAGKIAKCYFNDTIVMFLGSLMLAAAVEQSGLHHRLALRVMRCMGHSHYRLLFGICAVTTFTSMWIDNTAATTMMMPIVFALLHVFEDEGLINIFDEDEEGNKSVSSIARCYFCSLAYSASIGGTGTLLGSGTNLVFKGLFQEECKQAKDYLSFAYFSAFSIPYMIVMELLIYLWMIFKYFGFLRPESAAAKRSHMSPTALENCKKAVDDKWKDLGQITSREVAVIILFLLAVLSFFSRSPVLFVGWGDLIESYYYQGGSALKDSANSYLFITLMAFLPYSCRIFKHFTAKFKDDVPRKPIKGILDWTAINERLPFSFIFLLGGGFSLSTAANKNNSDLNSVIGEVLQKLIYLPNPAIIAMLIVVTVIFTNFSINIASVNVLGPLAMTMAKSVKQNPLQYIITVGFSASFTFLLPIGTPPNLVVQTATKMRTVDMIVAGSMPTLTTILVTYPAIMYWAPVVWPDISDPVPAWCADTPTETPKIGMLTVVDFMNDSMLNKK